MRFLIIGCGRVGAGLAHVLILRGHNVTVVDNDPDAFRHLQDGFKGKTVLGVGFDRAALIEAGIERTDGLAAVTSSDETNIVAARIARDIFHVPRVVARLFDPRQAEIYKRMGLQTISPVSWGVTRIADLLLHSQLDTVLGIGSGDIDLLEVETPLILVGKKVHHLTVHGEIHVVAITRAGKSFLPTQETVFYEGDLLHLACLAASKDRLEELLGL